MSTRLQRLNPLLRREVSDLLRSRYRDELPGVTVVDVSVSPDLRQARVLYSVLGEATAPERARDFFRRMKDEIRRELGRRIVLKYLPELRFVATDAVAEGSRILHVMDELGLEHLSPAEAAALAAEVQANAEAEAAANAEQAEARRARWEQQRSGRPRDEADADGAEDAEADWSDWEIPAREEDDGDEGAYAEDDDDQEDDGPGDEGAPTGERGTPQ